MALHKQSLKLLAQVKEIIESYEVAITLRQLYYQLVARQIIPNQQQYYAKLSRLCVIGRDEGLLPEDAFADRLRQIDKLNSWLDLADYMDTVKRAYRKNKWQNQDTYIEIWTEKDALRGVLTEITHFYDVALLVARGQISRTEIYKAYCRYRQQVQDGKACYLYYCGDFDPSGLSIYHSLVERITSHGEYGQCINFERIALTPEQIEAYDLPSDPAKDQDPNYKRFVSEYGDRVVELDALPPDVLRDIVEECIRQHIDQSLFLQVRETELAEHARLQSLPACLE